MRSIFGLTLATVVALVGTTHAGIIYDNGAPDFVDGIASDADFPNLVVDDFILDPGSNVITDIHWWGIYAFGNTLPDDNFTISIFEQVAGVPTVVALHEFNVGSVGRTNTGDSVYSYDVYEYWVDIAPITLNANTTYYLGISNNTPLSYDNWYWATSSAGSGNSFGRPDAGFGWGTMPNDFAFYLTDDANAPIPEPATMSLLGMGLAGLAMRARRRKA